MSKIINLGCNAAGVHHRYQEVHGALFGASSFRLVIDAMRGKRRSSYNEFSRKLEKLHEELATLDTQVTALSPKDLATGADRELQQVLLEYIRVLSKTIAGLQGIFGNLEQDESGYRETGADGCSRFTGDKLRYDHLLLELERLGTRLNRLFANY